MKQITDKGIKNLFSALAESKIKLIINILKCIME